MMRRPVFDYWTDPALEVEDDDHEPEPLTAEVLTVTGGLVWWTAAPGLDDDD